MLSHGWFLVFPDHWWRFGNLNNMRILLISLYLWSNIDISLRALRCNRLNADNTRTQSMEIIVVIARTSLRQFCVRPNFLWALTYWVTIHVVSGHWPILAAMSVRWVSQIITLSWNNCWHHVRRWSMLRFPIEAVRLCDGSTLIFLSNVSRSWESTYPMSLIEFIFLPWGWWKMIVLLLYPRIL